MDGHIDRFGRFTFAFRDFDDFFVFAVTHFDQATVGLAQLPQAVLQRD
jgi:hypothetical protein